MVLPVKNFVETLVCGALMKDFEQYFHFVLLTVYNRLW